MTNTLLGSDVRLYKYLSPEAALAVLQNKSLRCSAAKHFNDPFDMPVEFGIHFDASEVMEALANEIVQIVYGADEPSGPLGPKFAPFLFVRRHCDRIPRAEFETQLAVLKKQFPESEFIQQNETLRKYLQDSREWKHALLCLSRIHDNLLMWAHYARNHTGCVLGFRCLPEKDRPLCAAQPVTYQAEYPVIATHSEYVAHLMGKKPLDVDNLFKRFAFTKSIHWAYEQEYRLMFLSEDTTNGLYYSPFIEEELDTIYLGCNVSDEFKANVLRLRDERYPAARVFQGSLMRREYSLGFELVC